MVHSNNAAGTGLPHRDWRSCPTVCNSQFPSAYPLIPISPFPVPFDPKVVRRGLTGRSRFLSFPPLKFPSDPKSTRTAASYYSRILGLSTRISNRPYRWVTVPFLSNQHACRRRLFEFRVRLPYRTWTVARRPCLFVIRHYSTASYLRHVSRGCHLTSLEAVLHIPILFSLIRLRIPSPYFTSLSERI